MNRFSHLSRTAAQEVESLSKASIVSKIASSHNEGARSGLRISSRAKLPAGLSVIAMLALLLTSLFSAAGKVEAHQAASTNVTTKASTNGTTTDPFRFPAYFIEWGIYDRDYVPADIPADQVTTLNYAFINPADLDSDGMYECSIIDTWGFDQKPMQRLVPGTDVGAGENLGLRNQFKVLRRNHPNIKLLMSIGGWTLSTNFTTIASTAAQRSHFAQSCGQFMVDKGFDGIDIDWEFPAVSDRDNFTALLQALRDELDTLGQPTGIHYPLTIAGPPGTANIAAVNLPAISNILDYANVMTYDFGGGFDNIASHNSPLCASPENPRGTLWNSSGAVQQYIDGGFPASKLNVGLAYYGRAVQHLADSGPNPMGYPGRFAPITPNDFVTGTWDHLPPYILTGVFDYWDIKDRFSGPFQSSVTPIPGVNGYTRYWDNQEIVPFVFRPDAVGTSGAGRWLSYDDPQSLTLKVNYARTLGLGGVFVWELSQEGHPGTIEHPLSDAISAAIAAPLINFTCPNGGATVTPAPTHTATATSTSVPSTPTRTHTVAPTQTPGGATATTAPSNTPVPPTNTPGAATATSIPTVITCDITFSDVPADSTFYSYIRCLACRGIISGYADGTFRPGNNVTRGQLSKIVANAAGFNDTPAGQSFEDVPTDNAFYMFIERMSSRGIIGGYACGGAGEPCGADNLPYFRPNANATRGQISKIVSNAAGYEETPTGQTFQDIPTDNAFYMWIGRLVSRGVMGGYACGGVGEPCGPENMPYFRPYNNATRGQVSKIVANTFYPDCQTP